MKFARVISLFLALLLVVGVFASCTSSCSDEGTSSTQSGTQSGEQGSVGEFNQGDEVEDNNIPGDDTNSDSNNNGGNNQVDNYDDPSDDDGDDYDETEASYFDEKSLLTYCYETNYYAYGITDAGDEVFAFKEKDGSYYDVMYGAGKLILKSNDLEIMSVDSIASYDRSFMNNTLTVTVRYTYNSSQYEVDASKNFVEVNYSFYDEYVDVGYHIVFNSSKAITKDDSIIKRSLCTDYESSYKQMLTKWNYPQDNDHPYKSVRGWSTRLTFDDKHSIYTINYGNAPQQYAGVYLSKSYPDLNVPLFMSTDSSKSIDFTAQYAIVFCNTEDKNEAAYRAYFLSDKSNFAAGISSITKNDDNTTIYVKDKVDLNLNITNLTKSDMTADVRYDIRDYYGNVIDSGIYLESTVFGGLEANRKITIDAKKHGYGMYFVNFKVFTKRYIYYDYYPLIILEDADYPERSQIPFGITQSLESEFASLQDQTSMYLKLGNGYTRRLTYSVNTDKEIKDTKNMITTLQQAGMFISSMYTMWTPFNSPDAQIYYQHYAKYFKHYLVGNELNMQVNSVTEKVDSPDEIKLVNQVWNNYVNDTVTDQKQICKDYGWTFIYAGISAGTRYWYDKIAQSGDWNTNSILAVHGYSMSNKHPDAIEDIQNDRLWSHEAFLIRTQKAINDYAAKYNGFKKRWFVNEVGYSSPFFGSVADGDRHMVDIRTKADYDIRCLVTSIAYGAEKATLYCLFDYDNSGMGTNQYEKETGFGAFYMPDFYGRIMPKPTANAFITLTKTLGGVKQNGITESSKYSNGPLQDKNGGGKLRVFDVNTVSKGHILVAWSNIKRQVNDSITYGGIRSSRDPALPWNPTNFIVTEDLVVESNNAYVTIVRLGGKEEQVKVVGGKATIAVNGSPIFIIGAK